jgi:hypothetical protein
MGTAHRDRIEILSGDGLPSQLGQSRAASLFQAGQRYVLSNDRNRWFARTRLESSDDE